VGGVAADFLVKLWLAPHKAALLRHHWPQTLGLLLPTLRLLSFVLLARVLSSSSRTAGSAKQLVRSRLAYLSGLSSIAVVAIGELGLLAEGGHHSQLPDLGAAVLWSAATVLGRSPTFTPVTAVGQLVMVVGFVVGLVLITTLAGTLGSVLLESHTEHRRSAESAAPPAEYEGPAATGGPP
jgi:voltage-gated potassium channel